MNARYTVLLAAAVALALPAFAANENGKAQPPAAEKAAPAAKDQAAKTGKEEVAEEEDELAAPLPGRSSNGKAAPDKAGAAPTKTLRFERWVHDEDNEY